MDDTQTLLNKYSFRVIVTRKYNGPLNMAVDETLLNGVREGEAVLRFYDWRPAALSLGYFQRLRKAELDECRRRGIPLVRRPTGGRAVFHDDEITYSASLPISGGLGRSWSTTYYAALSRLLLNGLIKLGVTGAKIQPREKGNNSKSKAIPRGQNHASTPWCFDAQNFCEIAVEGRKLIGSAQRLYPRGLLQHGSILRDIAPDYENLFWGPRQKDGRLAVTSLKEILGRKPGFMEVVEAYTAALSQMTNNWRFSELTEEERDSAKRLLEEKYQYPDWPIRQGLGVGG